VPHQDIILKLKMSNPFFDHPILNSPYEAPSRHWELDDQGQPTQRIIDSRRRAEFITPISKPRKRKSSPDQARMVLDEGKGLSTAQQEYDPTSIINEVRQRLEAWRTLPDPFDWKVTPETARLLQHWRSHKFSSIRTRHRRVAIKRHVRVGFLNHPDPKDFIRLRTILSEIFSDCANAGVHMKQATITATVKL